MDHLKKASRELEPFSVCICSSPHHHSDPFQSRSLHSNQGGRAGVLLPGLSDSGGHPAPLLQPDSVLKTNCWAKKGAEGRPGHLGSLALLRQLPTILCQESQTFLLQTAFCLPQSPGLLAGWLSCDMEELAGLHGDSNPLVQGGGRMEREAGGVSSPARGTVALVELAVSWASSERKGLRS